MNADGLAFGKPNRPPTPIDGVISNHYGDAALHEIQERYEMQHEIVNSPSNNPFILDQINQRIELTQSEQSI